MKVDIEHMCVEEETHVGVEEKTNHRDRVATSPYVAEEPKKAILNHTSCIRESLYRITTPRPQDFPAQSKLLPQHRRPLQYHHYLLPNNPEPLFSSSALGSP